MSDLFFVCRSNIKFHIFLYEIKYLHTLSVNFFVCFVYCDCCLLVIRLISEVPLITGVLNWLFVLIWWYGKVCLAFGCQLGFMVIHTVLWSNYYECLLKKQKSALLSNKSPLLTLAHQKNFTSALLTCINGAVERIG